MRINLPALRFRKTPSEHDGERVPTKEALAIIYSVGNAPMLRSLRAYYAIAVMCARATQRDGDRVAAEAIPIKNAARDRAQIQLLRGSVTASSRAKAYARG